MSDSNSTWLQTLCSLPFIGEWVSTIFTFIPFLLLISLEAATGLEADFGPWQTLALSLVMIAWLIFLERWQNVRMNTPYVPIKILWLMPIFVVVSIGEIVGIL